MENDKGKSRLHQSICAIRFASIKKSAKYGFGSGVLISKDVVLTVAHNVYDKDQSAEPDMSGYEVYVGVNGITDTFYEVEAWRYLDKYKTCDIK